MKIKQTLKNLLGMNRYDAADKFNKAAILGAPIATGYAMNGAWGAFNSAFMMAFGAFMLGPQKKLKEYVAEQSRRLNLAQSTVGVFDDTGSVAQEVRRLKDIAGIDEEIEVRIVHSDVPVSVAKDSSGIQVLVSSDTLNVMPPDELFAVLGHEIAHVKHNDVKNFNRLEFLSFMGALGNIFKSVVESPFVGGANILIALGAGVAQLGLLTFQKKNAEYRADAFAMEHGDAKAFLRSFDRMRPNATSIGMGAVQRYNELLKKMPSRVSSLVQSKPIPVPVMQWLFALKPYFSGSHPSQYKREEKMVEHIRKTDPDFVKPEYDVPTELEICGPCSGMTGDVNQYNATFMIRDLFEHVHGHDDVRVAFSDKCDGQQAMPFGLGGVFIIVAGPDDQGEMRTYGMDFE